MPEGRQAGGATIGVRAAPTGAPLDPAYDWRGAALRPTGVVVFTSLERRPGTVRLRPSPVGGPSPCSPHARPAHVWRERARRGVDWLLGR